MNWKWMVAGVIGVLLGLSIAPLQRRSVLASVAPTGAHFQMHDAMVDESNGEGQNIPTHEIFLLDTESGKVWKFQGMVWSKDKNGPGKIFREPTFVTVAVESGK
jgi:hypothetical protein